ncbi:MAG: thiol:disulfide interchange protein [Proteobacteria bacterium]|nr:thiol:disulfide interchange protein [Pseudomonadota bacterium]NDG25670.1 thiol:disulfide interchange protein [Pseudomonadota bacterium]
MFKVLLAGLLVTCALQAEQGLSQQDAQFLQMMQQKAEAEEREQEFKTPKKPKLSSDRAVLGSLSAPIVIVAYSDFQCPYCSRGAGTIEEVRKKYGKKVGFIFKHLPLPFHQMAQPAAEYFEAIAIQDPKKAYRFHDEVFKNQGELQSGGEDFLSKIAKQVGADLARLKKDRSTPKVQKRIEEDKKEAQEFGIQGTPGFIVAGVTLKGAYPLASFEEIIERRLKSK